MKRILFGFISLLIFGNDLFAKDTIEYGKLTSMDIVSEIPLAFYPHNKEYKNIGNIFAIKNTTNNECLIIVPIKVNTEYAEKRAKIITKNEIKELENGYVENIFNFDKTKCNLYLDNTKIYSLSDFEKEKARKFTTAYNKAHNKN